MTVIASQTAAILSADRNVEHIVAACQGSPRFERSAVKSSTSWDDAFIMASHEISSSSQDPDRPRMQVYGVTSFVAYSDEELILERDRRRKQMDELTMRRGASPSLIQLIVSIDREVERMTDELTRRATAKHPASRSLRTRLGMVSPTRPPKR